MREITVLDSQQPEGGLITVRAVFWYPVPKGFEIPKPTVQSIIPKEADVKGGVTLDEIGLLQKGTVVEESRAFVLPADSDIGYVEDFLVRVYKTRADFFTLIPFKGQLLGLRLIDGTWTQ